MLRLWRTPEASWRASLEDPHTGERRAFASPAHLLAFLDGHGGDSRATRPSASSPETTVPVMPQPPGPARVHWLDGSALLRSVAPMAIMWTGWVLLATWDGYPGVICITPMAWLMALWTGIRFASLTAGRAAQWPLLGSAVAGAVLGMYLGLVFAAVSAFSLAAGVQGDELARTWVFTLGMVIASVLICAALSMLTSWLTGRRRAPSMNE